MSDHARKDLSDPVGGSLSVSGEPIREPEQCICAAIQLRNGEVWRGHRHDGALQAAGKAPGVSRDDLANAVQGFVTSRNRFVDRTEGADIQRMAGIASATTGDFPDFLFSEDLYLRDWRPTDWPFPLPPALPTERTTTREDEKKTR